MPAAGDPVLASDVRRARPTIYWDSASGSLGASQTNILVPGCQIVFTTETDAAEVTFIWFADFDLNGAVTTLMSASVQITAGPATSSSPVFATFSQGPGNALDRGSPGNSWSTVLGDAGTYTCELRATTGVTQAINIYTSFIAIVGEQFE